ncbi:MAG: NUDIX hydrolase [Oligoflexales bacterium]|nr:NUDIX hydrolase [Oligoflexales bacterium]
MEIGQIIKLLEPLVPAPQKGLPEELFLFITKITPMINVDLLIKNDLNHTLLTWRDDGLWPAGWHIPGGIIRFKESSFDRLKEVAATELGTTVDFEKSPIAVNEVIEPCRMVRGHFISLLYKCKLTGNLDEIRRYESGKPKPGEWAWFDKCPENILEVHEMYREYI